MSAGDQSQLATPSSPTAWARNDTFLPSLENVNQHFAPGLVRQTDRALLGAPAPLSDRRWLDRNVPLGGSNGSGVVDDAPEPALVVGPPEAVVMTVLSLVPATVVDGPEVASDVVASDVSPAPVVLVPSLVEPPEPHPTPMATVNASAPAAATTIRREVPRGDVPVSRNDTGVILPYPDARGNAECRSDGAPNEGR